MTLQQYQEESQRTNVDLGSLMLNNIHMVLGMTSEMSELNEAIRNKDLVNVSEELTDIQWYNSNYCTQNGWELEEVSSSIEPDITWNGNYHILLLDSISELANIHKRELAYKKQPNFESAKKHCTSIQYSLKVLYSFYNLDMEQCLQNNIDKLRKRFPYSFSEHHALNRNLDAERKELEK